MSYCLFCLLNFVAMATRVGRGGICVTSFNSLTTKTRVEPKDLRDTSYTSRVISDFVSNIVAIATRLAVVEFFWHPSIARPRKPRDGRKDLIDISYKSRVIADFVSDFLAMTTWVGSFKKFSDII